MPKLLVVDNESSIVNAFRRIAESQQYQLQTCHTSAQAVDFCQSFQPDVVVTDIRLPDGSGLDLYKALLAIDAKMPVVFITEASASNTVIEAMRMGAFEFLVKPLDPVEVRSVLSQAINIRQLMNDPVAIELEPSDLSIDGAAMVGRCAAMQQVYKAIGRVASQNVTVLVRGESGTGKELIARALYQFSNRSDGPFMAINCAAIPDNLLDSELFGHEKGAFTGADRRRVGKFEQCNGGTLFLDEVGDMSPVLQSKLLRVLQERSFERVGSNESVKTDVRVIAATNRDLESMVAQKEFRADLYYRLNGFTINLPALRDRGDDLLLLVDHFRARANHDLGKNIQRIAAETIERLKAYHWPGNIRELQSVLRHAAIQSSGPVLIPEFLPPLHIDKASSSLAVSFAKHDSLDGLTEDLLATGSERIYDQVIEVVEAKMISRVLQATQGNQVEAARILGVTRTTLRTKLNRLGIVIDRVINQT